MSNRSTGRVCTYRTAADWLRTGGPVVIIQTARQECCVQTEEKSYKTDLKNFLREKK